jgi:hypothetical protein
VSDRSLRRVLVATLLVCSLAVGGCLTLDPTVSTDVDDSAVFESVSVSESWASQRIRASATLAATPEAANVTQITVIEENGKTFSTVNTAPGQTSVVLQLPPNENATLVASDTVNGTTIEKLNVTTGGRTLP